MKPITYGDLYQFHFISDAKLSPDATRVLFTKSMAVKGEDKYQRQMWMRDLEKGHLRYMAGDDIRAASWLDGEHLIFTSESKALALASPPKDGTVQTVFFVMSSHGGEARPFMTVPLKDAVAEPLYDRLFLIQAVDDALQENDEDCFVADELPFWFNGKGITNKKRHRIYIGQLSEAAGTDCSLMPLTHEKEAVVCVALSLDRTKIAYSVEYCEGIHEHETKIWLYDVKEKQKLCVYDGGGECVSLCFMGDNKLFFERYTYEWAGKNPKFMCLDLNQGTASAWPFYDCSVGNSVGSDVRFGGGKTIAYDDGKLYYVETGAEDSYVAVLNDRGERSYVNKLCGAVTGFDVAHGKMVISAQRDCTFAELYRVDLSNGDEYPLTDFNEAYLKSHSVCVPERFTYASNNGYEMTGFVLKPAGYIPGQKYPVILSMHGGPKMIYGNVFLHEMQCQANDGYFVIYVNPRGSDGRGERFADLTEALGTWDFDDFMEFADQALSRYPDMDKDRMGICGGSYGGFMCNWMIGHTKRFKAAVSMRSISNYVTKLLCTDIGYYHNKRQIGAYPWEDFDKVWEHSPLKLSMYAKTPTLFIQSDEDYRCYMSDALQLFSALKRNGCDTRMLLFHGENHELSRSGKPSNRITRLREMGKWFDQYLKTEVKIS